MEQLRGWGGFWGRGAHPSPSPPAWATHLQLAVLVHSEVAWLQVLGRGENDQATGGRELVPLTRPSERPAHPPPGRQPPPVHSEARSPEVLKHQLGRLCSLLRFPQVPQIAATLLSLAFEAGPEIHIPCPPGRTMPSLPLLLLLPLWRVPRGGGRAADTALTLWTTPAEWMYCVGEREKGGSPVLRRTRLLSSESVPPTGLASPHLRSRPSATLQLPPTLRPLSI